MYEYSLIIGCSIDFCGGVKMDTKEDISRIKKRSVLFALNKEKLSRYELDDLFA